ncbi:MAG: hypothetical protein RI955_1397 [Bacteroidota bacterium]|jgi:1-aminocyclopropane-1-carboxylate deaminase
MNLPDVSLNFMQQIFHPILDEKQVTLYVLRLDLIHPEYGGNKWFKLKYHMDDAIKKGYKTVGSFGGPWSNHLAALAAFGKDNHLNTIGKVRFAGNYTKYPTLVNAEKNGMQLLFLTNDEFDIENKNGAFTTDKNVYWIPSGGHTTLGVKGCEEILKLKCVENILPLTSHIIVPVGNATTLAGISNSALIHQKIIAIPALKNAAYLSAEIKLFTKSDSIEWWLDYHFGGFGKTNALLNEFMIFANNNLQIPLDKVYTAKMMYGIWHNIQQDYFAKQSTLLAIHTGGLQGNL